MLLEESLLCCPKCRMRLFKTKSSLKCLSGHSFDISKEGYVNLLMSNSAGKRHGDDKLMVDARRTFLEHGYYAPLRDTVKSILGYGQKVLDIGCGEGYYTSAFAENNTVVGIDISKDAIKCASKRCKNTEFAVASVASIPLHDKSINTIINIFAPDSPFEFLRILNTNGRLIMVYPMENHLIELKTAVYDKPELNPKVNLSRDGMTLKTTNTLKYGINLDNNQDIISLFKMTPYYYKTSKADQQKLSLLDSLTVTAEFLIAEYTLS